MKSYLSKHLTECDRWGKSSEATSSWWMASACISGSEVRQTAACTAETQREQGGFNQRVRDYDATQCKNCGRSCCDNPHISAYEYTIWKSSLCERHKNSKVAPNVVYYWIVLAINLYWQSGSIEQIAGKRGLLFISNSFYFLFILLL